MRISFARYLLLQCRRALKLLPQVLLVTLLLAGAAALAGVMISAIGDADAAKQKAAVGIVGDPDDRYLRLGVHALERFDASGASVRFEFMEEDAALSRLRSGELSAYMVVPPDFVASVYAGDIRPIRYVSLRGAAGVGAALPAELAEAVSDLMLETLNAQYGAQRYVVDNLPDADPYTADNALVDRYISAVLDRDELVQVEIVGVSGALSYNGYYLCGIAAALLLLWGVGCGPLFSERSGELGLTLKARGFGAARQVLGEYPAFLGLTLLGALCAALAALLLLRSGLPRVPELEDASPPRLAGAVALCAAMFCAMQFFLYELVPSAVGGILLQFLNAAVQSYVCGCFYPYAFFPEGLRRLGAALPAGVGLRLLGGALTGSGGVYGAAAPAYLFAFLGLSALVRRRRLAG